LVACLSKKSFLSGAQCHRRLWWELHDPTAYELRESAAVRHRLDEGTRVGTVARTYIPNGRLISRTDRSIEEILRESEAALADPATVALFEPAFLAHDTLVHADVLERCEDGWVLVEVKMTSSVSRELHIPDLAIQTYVLRKAGVSVVRCELMHLNRDCRHPDLANLFVREDVTSLVEARVASIAGELEAMVVAARAEQAPDVAPGDHCSTPSECPFTTRCWPRLPDHHVSTLYSIRKKKAAEFVEAGWHTIHDLPEDVQLSAIAARQRRSVRAGELHVERGSLVSALASLVRPVAHIDFETVQPAIPVWPGCRPFDQIPVQLSCHVVAADGTTTHQSWLFDGVGDPRPGIARAIVEACRGASTVTAYYSAFEKGCIELVAEACPELAEELRGIAACIVDLLPIVRSNVYHPGFGGSFSLKKVLPALVEGLNYEGLAIAEGETAQAELARLIFAGHTMDDTERADLRKALLAYCQRDTEAMVALHARLEMLAAS
jgi:hypothetical protein